MAHYNSISTRIEFGRPPAHYKHVGKPNQQTGKFNISPPDLQLLNSGDRDYKLVFHGFQDHPIPLKWNNNWPFAVGPNQFVKDLGEKYT